MKMTKFNDTYKGVFIEDRGLIEINVEKLVFLRRASGLSQAIYGPECVKP